MNTAISRSLKRALLVVLSISILFAASMLPGVHTYREDPSIRPTGIGLTLKYPSYSSNVINLTGDQEKIIGKGTWGNITLSGNSLLTVLGPVRVNGIIKITGNSTLEISGGEMRVVPPPIGRNDNVIRVQDTGKLIVKKQSNLMVNPQPVTILDQYKRNNASFIELDDEGRITVDNSKFTAILPGDVTPESVRVTGGTILVTGNAVFEGYDSEIDAFLNFTEIDDGITQYVELTRWFWISSQRYGTIRFENSTVTLHEPGQTLIKPTNGKLILRNSVIHGNVRPETIAEFEITNCDIHNVNDHIGYASIHEAIEINDHAVGTITGSRIYGEVKTGWSSTNEFLGKASNTFTFRNCEFYSEGIRAFANTSMSLIDCRIISDHIHFEIADRTRLYLKDTELEEVVIECGEVEFLKAIAENISITMDNARIDRLFSPDLDVTANLELANGSEIGILDMHFSNEFANKSFKAFLRDGSTVFFNNTGCGELEIVLHNSVKPAISGTGSVIIRERYTVTGSIELNDEMVHGAEVCLRYQGETIGMNISHQGTYMIEFDRKVLEQDEEVLVLDGPLEVEVSFLGFKETIPIDVDKDTYRVTTFEDIAPPIIQNISWTPASWNHKDYITVSADITDPGSGTVGSVLLEYRINGDSWKNLSMFRINGSRYQAVLPRMDIGDEVEIRIIAEDILGNKGNRTGDGFRSGEEVITLGIVLSIVILISISCLLVVRVIGRFKHSRYRRKSLTGEENMGASRISGSGTKGVK